MIITRFAPSPTGPLHIGGARTALFAWLYAKSNGGKCLLRFEDTDLNRSKSEHVSSISNSFRQLKIDFDDQPIYQSTRKERHIELVQCLLDSGNAYKCNCSKKMLDDLRQRQMEDGLKPKYDGKCRNLDLDLNKDYVVRFKNPQEGNVEYVDIVRGHISIANNELDDLIILRSDRSPTYNLSVVADDADMKITHVIRGDDHINNTPRQINIFKALNLKVPEYGHVPMILGEDGTRMSKRHGAIGVSHYINLGLSSTPLINYLARLGWSYGDQEIFTLDDLIKKFKLGKINSSPSTFSLEKLYWFNKEYLSTKSSGMLLDLLKEKEDFFSIDPDYSMKIIDLIRDRCTTLNELIEESIYFFKELKSYEEGSSLKFFTEDGINILSDLLTEFLEINDWNINSINDAIKQVMNKNSVGMGKVGQPFRVAMTGSAHAPAIDKIALLLGKDKVLIRLKKSINLFS